MKKLNNPALETLFKGVLALKTTEECFAFFDDICTKNELQALASRLDIAIQLTEGKTYIEIGENTGASTATISRVNRALNYGAGGYKIVTERLSDK